MNGINLKRCLAPLIVFAMAFFAIANTASAWDAGTASRLHKEGSGGENSISILDTRLKWAKSRSLESSGRVADCPSGYTNVALGCVRGTKDTRYPSRLKTCRSGYTNMGTFCGKGFANLGSTHALSSGTCSSGYFSGALGRCYKKCPSGETNTGDFCHRPASSKPQSSMTCKAGEARIQISVTKTPRCYPKPVCPTGYEYWGWRCYVTSPGVKRTAVSTVVHKVKQGGNTHLWVVNQALNLLKNSRLPGTQAFVNKMNQPAIRRQWEQGIWDGDSEAKGYVDHPSAPGSHFYNGAGKSRTGSRTSVITYSTPIESPVRPKSGQLCANARECAKLQLGKVTKLKTSTAHALGLALHYMTDITQPMHSSGWGGNLIPINGHPQWEYYAAYVQGKFPSRSWDKRWINTSPDLILHNAAVRSNGYAPRLSKTLHITGDAGICTIQAFNGIGPYTGYCFYNEPSVDKLTGEIFQSAYQSTASYLYAFMRSLSLPAVNNTPVTTTVSGKGVTVYQHCNYAGYAIKLIPGRYNLRQLRARGVKNDDVSSIRVTNGLQAVVYQHDNFQGKSWNLRANESCFVAKGLNDVASSIVVKARGSKGGASNANQETNCFNNVQGKVAWSQAGKKTWGPANIKKLCAGTRNPSRTIACFKQGIASHNDWNKAINSCRGRH